VTRRVVEQWGTVISLDIRDEIGEPVVDACVSWFQRVDDLFSTWRAGTEIMRIGEGSLAITEASTEVVEVLARCERMRIESNGAFDVAFGARPEVPKRVGVAPIDPSGFVKGWAVAHAASMLHAAGASCFTIGAGGDVVACGRPDDSPAGWRVGIQHPWQRDKVAAVVAVTDGAVATSGRYERGNHVFDPRTGRAVEGLASVTVVGEDLATADAYATAVMVLGPDSGLRWLTSRAGYEGRTGYEGLAIRDDHTVVSTPGFARYRIS
jgi:thiamine biosynthesis lipoprotein